jgi:alkylation response protein AidB-like acyl-CoA dehydrogenase
MANRTASDLRDFAMEAGTTCENIRALSAEFATERRERQGRRELVAADFARLRDAGFLLTGVPVDHGGIWESVSRSTRPICEMLRTLAHGDSSIALVCAMHPLVLSVWMATAEASPPFDQAWQEQRNWIFRNVREGAWWGPSPRSQSPGAISARPGQRLAGRRPTTPTSSPGRKNFGSGSGITSHMITMAVPEGETAPDLFFLDMLGVPWDGSAGATLTAAWDGHGMAATQSHAFSFREFPVIRAAWPSQWPRLGGAFVGFGQCCFTSVIVGVAEVALEIAREQVARRRDNLRAYERVEWTRAELEGWLIEQAYEGMLRAVEQDRGRRRHAAQGKTAIAELAESVLRRISRVIGGRTFSRSSPFGYWYEDVRALGFLRPPWGLAYDQLFAA